MNWFLVLTILQVLSGLVVTVIVLMIACIIVITVLGK